MNSKYKIILLAIILASCTSTKSVKKETSKKKYVHDIHLVKGINNCNSENTLFQTERISVKFENSLCDIFKKELDSIGDTVLWHMESVKKDFGMKPVSSWFIVYKESKKVYTREMSFITLPSYKDKSLFEESTYYKILQSNPKFELDSSVKPRTYYGVQITIKKE